MKKLKIQGFLASLLAAAVLTCPASAMSFPDVDSNSDYSAAVEYVSKLGIMVGDTQGNFNPDKIVNRAEMAAIVCRVLGQTENLPATNAFTDVPAAHWANAYIGKSSELKIVNGYGNGKFGLSDPVTYEQAVTMIVRAIGESDKANSYGGYPNGFLLAAQENGLLKGIPAVLGQGLSRGSVAVLLYNYYTTRNNASAPDGGHVHQYTEKTVTGLGHNLETKMVTTVVLGTEKYWLIECHGCLAHFYTTDDLNWHQDPNNPDALVRCWDKGSDMYLRERNITEERTATETKWVEDPPAVFFVCEICGHEDHIHYYVYTLIDNHPEQVEVGTESYGWYTCTACGFGSESQSVVFAHQNETGHPPSTGSEPRYRPVYEKQWVLNTTRVCSICGQQEP